MWIEALLDQIGIGATFALAVGLIAAPLAVVGGRLRGRARAARDRWALIDAARGPLRELKAGRVAASGSWRNLEPGRALIEDHDDAALVERSVEAAAVADGARVLVVGWATRQTDLLGGYRRAGRVWRIEGDGAADPVVVSPLLDLPARAARAARRRALVGAGLIALGVAVTACAAAVCAQASAGDYAE